MTKTRKKAVSIAERLSATLNQQYLVRSMMDKLNEQEAADRKELAATLFTLIAEDQDALADGWVSHWCMAVENADLHRLAFNHFQEQQRSGEPRCSAWAYPVGMPNNCDCSKCLLILVS
jgi:hypothetical protein